MKIYRRPWFLLNVFDFVVLFLFELKRVVGTIIRGYFRYQGKANVLWRWPSGKGFHRNFGKSDKTQHGLHFSMARSLNFFVGCLSNFRYIRSTFWGVYCYTGQYSGFGRSGTSFTRCQFGSIHQAVLSIAKCIPVADSLIGCFFFCAVEGDPTDFILVGGWPTPLINMSSSVGMIIIPTIGENRIHVLNQPVYIYIYIIYVQCQ